MQMSFLFFSFVISDFAILLKKTKTKNFFDSYFLKKEKKTLLQFRYYVHPYCSVKLLPFFLYI